jgi:uncharacterized protein
MTFFTGNVFVDSMPYVAASIGGLLIGLSAVLLMWFLGRIAGISGIAVGLMSAAGAGNRGWRVAFILGLIGAGFLLQPFASATPVAAVSPIMLMLAGLLVGFGSVLGSGCTSGHGVCGLGRRSVRSLVATMVFMGAAIVTVFIMRHVVA